MLCPRPFFLSVTGLETTNGLYYPYSLYILSVASQINPMHIGKLPATFQVAFYIIQKIHKTVRVINYLYPNALNQSSSRLLIVTVSFFGGLFQF